MLREQQAYSALLTRHVSRRSTRPKRSDAPSQRRAGSRRTMVTWTTMRCLQGGGQQLMSALTRPSRCVLNAFCSARCGCSVRERWLCLRLQERLLALFEEHAPGGKGWLQRVVDGMEGFSQRDIARQLKAQGLRRGHLTANQVGLLSAAGTCTQRTCS